MSIHGCTTDHNLGIELSPRATQDCASRGSTSGQPFKADAAHWAAPRAGVPSPWCDHNDTMVMYLTEFFCSGDPYCIPI